VVRKLRKNRKFWNGTAAVLDLAAWLPRDLRQAYRRFSAFHRAVGADTTAC
jgi:hypothetical protein